MNDMKMMVFGLGFAALTASAVPSAAVVRCAVVDNHVEVDYVLSGEDAIVTMAVATDAAGTAFLDERKVTALEGAVNRQVKVSASESDTRHIRWDVLRDGATLNAGASVVLTAWTLDAPPDILTFSPLHADSVRFYTSTNALPGGLMDRRYRCDEIVMRKIPAKGVTWKMGTASGNYVKENEKPQHSITLTNDYYMGFFEVTAAQYYAITGVNVASAAAKGMTYDVKDHAIVPASGVSYDAIRGSKADGIDWPTTKSTVSSGSFLGLLRKKTGLSGLDIPTEAEWEYACRAGCQYQLYDNNWLERAKVPALGWCYENAPKDSGGYNFPVECGRLKPNWWGLYDMLGNASEWCKDWADSDANKNYTPPEQNPQDGPVSVDTNTRAVRGAFAASSWQDMAIARRMADTPDTATNAGRGTNRAHGFRLVCPAFFR